MATKAQLEQDLINAVAKVRVMNQGAPMDVKFSNGKTYTVYSDGSGNAEDAGINFRDLKDRFNTAEAALRPAPTPAPTPALQQAQQQQEQPQSAPLSQNSSKSFALQNANAAFFPNLDDNGLPILNRSAIDAELKKGNFARNVLTADNSNIRDAIYGSGWNSKSDAVQVLNGAGVFGVSKTPSGMGGFQYTKPNGQGLTDTDFINAAKAAGLDPNNYYSKQNLGPMGAPINALNKNALYNALQEKGQDLYAITNTLQAAARGQTAPHATILFRADGDELKAITNPQTSQPAVTYFDATRYKPDPGIMGDLAPFLMLAPAIGGIIGGAGGIFGSNTAALNAGQVGANTASGFVGGLPGVEAGALMAGYTGAPLNALGVSAGLGGAGWLGADTLDNIIAGAIADTYNPTAPGYQVGPEGPAQIGTQQFPPNSNIGSSSILQDLKNGYNAYKTASQIASGVNQIMNPDQGLGGIDPTTGIANTIASLAAGKQLGALPNEGQGTFLQGAPVGENAALQPMQLQQLSPELGAVDPQLLSQLLNKNKPAMGSQQGTSHYTYGAIPAMQDTTYTGGAGALLSGKPVAQYDALGSAGLRQISGYKDGGEVADTNLFDMLDEWIASKEQTREQMNNLSPLEQSLLQKAYTLHKHDKYGTNKYPSSQDSVVSPLGPWDQPIEDMPGDFKFNNSSTGLGDRIRNDPYRYNEMDSMTKDWDGLGTERQQKMDQRYYAKGGETHNPEFITGKTGFYVEGKGDGQSDSIPAMLADGEYVFDADTVAALGNGSNKAGAAMLDKMRQSIRKHKRSASHKSIPPKAKSPLEYLKG